MPKIWEPSTHGGHHIASLLRKTDVDVMQCGQQPAWLLITLSPIPEAARCQLLLRAGQLRYLNALARKLPPKLQCQEMINITYRFSHKLHKKVCHQCSHSSNLTQKHILLHRFVANKFRFFFLSEICKEKGIGLHAHMGRLVIKEWPHWTFLHRKCIFCTLKSFY